MRRAVLLALSIAVLAVGGLGASLARTSGSPHREPEAQQPGERSFATTANPACTGGRRFQALVRDVGPFCAQPDSIPAIDDPAFVRAAEAVFLAPDEPVLALRLGEDARAYPLRLLVWHEIVNDTVAGRPVAVTFCPICNTGIAFDRRHAGRTLTFGVSGQLFGGNLVMFDRETETLWQQVTGEAVSGPLSPGRLRLLGVQMLPFATFAASAPGGLVMTEESGGFDDYGEDPYAGYGLRTDQPSEYQFGFEPDDRLPPRQRVVGVAGGRRAIALVPPRRSGGLAVATLRLDGERLVALFAFGLGQPSTGERYDAETPGWSGGVFRRTLGGGAVDLRPSSDGFVDRRTGSRFDPAGRAVEGPLVGLALERVAATDAYWFAWDHFHPGSRVIRAR